VTVSTVATAPAVDDAIVRLEGVSRHFGRVRACDDISLTVRRGEFFSLLGASGCGKTTLLRLLAGFEQPDQGRIFIDGVDVTGMPPYERPVNMMFQSYALFPHLNVADNVAYGLKQLPMARNERRQRVQDMLALVEIGDLARRKPQQLSGGQRQRVALARALARQPRILLLDEPLGALDRKLREKMQFELMQLQQRLGITFIVVTHDQEEAMTMSSRIALMNQGRIEQLDTPRRLYEYPATRFAADFIGLVNLFEGEVVRYQDGLVLVRSEHVQGELLVRHHEPLASGTAVTVALRPEKVRLLQEWREQPNRVRAVIRDIAYLGDVSVYHALLPGGRPLQFTLSNIHALAEQPLAREQEVALGWQPDSCGVLTR